MRVTFVVPQLNPATGGGSHHTFHLTAVGLCRLGLDVQVVALAPPRSALSNDLPYSVTVESGWQRSTRPARLRAVAEILARYESITDVFHVFDPEWVPAAGLYRRNGAVPTVATLNSFTLWCTDVGRMDGRCQRQCDLARRVLHAPTSPLRKLASLPVRVEEERSIFPAVRRLDHWLPNSPATKRTYEQAGFDLRRSTLVPAVIDFEAIRAAATTDRRRPTRRGGTRHLLYSGRLTAAKGVDVLVDALGRVTAPVHVHIAGDGPERASLEARARRQGVADRLTFHGWVPNRDLWNLLQTADAFVHPGRWPEPCSRSVLEALALGVPAIVSDVGGPPWQLDGCGAVFAPGDPADLARRIDELCANYPQAQAQAQHGVERAAWFDVHRWVPRIAEVYTVVTHADELLREADAESAHAQERSRAQERSHAGQRVSSW